MSLTINNKLCFIGSFQFLGSSIENVVKKLNKNNFEYLGQEFDSNVLDLVKQIWLYLYEYMTGFEKFKEELTSKEKFYRYLTDRKINMFLMFGKNLKWKQWKIITTCT